MFNRGKGINRFNVIYLFSCPVHVSGFEAHHSTITTPKTAMRSVNAWKHYTGNTQQMVSSPPPVCDKK